MEIFETMIGRFPMGDSNKIVGLNINTLKEALSDKFFLEALFLASPNLYSKMLNIDTLHESEDEKEKLYFSVMKYFLRYSFRITPFGLYSGSSVVSTIPSNNSIENKESFIRRTRLDMHFVDQMIRHLQKLSTIKKQLKYKLNTSLYLVDNSYRYVEFKLNKSNRKHKVVQVLRDDALDEIFQILKDKELSIERIIEKLSFKNEYEQAEIEGYIDSIIDSQFIVSEIEMSARKTDNFDTLLDTFSRFNDAEGKRFYEGFYKVKTKLDDLDREKQNNIFKYHDIQFELKALGFEVDISKLFQVDVIVNNKTAIKQTHSDSINEMIEFFSKKFPHSHSENRILSEFKERFTERYQDAFVPLTQVLDPEIGLGFPVNRKKGNTPLLGNLALYSSFGSVNEDIKFTKRDQFLMNWLVKNPKQKILDLNAIKWSEEEKGEISLPSMLQTFFRFGKINDEERLFFEYLGANNGINIIGRFSGISKEVDDHIDKIITIEKKGFKGAVLAEISHLPQSRVGNVICRKPLFDYEIPYLSNYSPDKKDAILVTDLEIGVQNNRIVLWSKKINKEVIPKLPNAHNFSNSSNPIYFFLSSLQSQNYSRNMFFNWGNVSKIYHKLPRVQYKNIIISYAQWKLNKDDIDELLTCIDSNKINDQKVKKWKLKHGLPRFVILVEGDNELIIDLENEYIVKMFISEVRKKSNILLKEYPFDLVEESFVPNQFIATLVNPSKKKYPTVEYFSPTIKQKFLSGLEWNFIKIYGGVNTVDRIFIDKIFGLLMESNNKNWFFIRYKDKGGEHLRLRFKPDPQGQLKKSILKVLENAIDKNLIAHVEEGIYEREIKRYKENAMEESEYFFHIDSKIITTFLNYNQDENKHIYRWMFALYLVDFYLSKITNNFEQKHKMIEPLKKGFQSEFYYSVQLKKEINKEYRSNLSKIEMALSYFSNEESHFKSIIDALELEGFSELDDLINNSYKNQTLNSFLHMCINRIFMESQRKHELIVYEYLSKYYLSGQKRMEKKKTSRL
ncbi:MAG: lantibiotic dehydratase [Flavobacteriales bacterium]